MYWLASEVHGQRLVKSIWVALEVCILSITYLGMKTRKSGGGLTIPYPVAIKRIQASPMTSKKTPAIQFRHWSSEDRYLPVSRSIAPEIKHRTDMF